MGRDMTQKALRTLLGKNQLTIIVKTLRIIAMKTQDAIQYFGSQVALKRALKLKARQTIHAWGEFPPDGRQYQIEVLTGGKLKAERQAKAA